MISGSCATREVFNTDGRDETVEMESEAEGSARQLLRFYAATCIKKKKSYWTELGNPFMAPVKKGK